MNEMQFTKMTGISEHLASRWFFPIDNSMKAFGISSEIDQAMFIAQVGHESGAFQQTVESLNYTPAALLKIYETRISPQQADALGRTNVHPAQQEAIANIVYGNRLGNKKNGDGWKYRGRGLIQITGLDNYLLCGAALKLNLVSSPELLEEDIHAAQSAAWFYVVKGCLHYSGDIMRITRMINGGVNGLEDRRIRFHNALKVMSI
jgi:putative chitinase